MFSPAALMVITVKLKVFIFGLDNAGKTSFIETFKSAKVYNDTRPTKALQYNNICLDQLELVIWDAPGQISFRKSWKKKRS